MKTNLSKTTSINVKMENERLDVALVWQQYYGILAMLVVLDGYLKPEPINSRKKSWLVEKTVEP